MREGQREKEREEEKYSHTRPHSKTVTLLLCAYAYQYQQTMAFWKDMMLQQHKFSANEVLAYIASAIQESNSHCPLSDCVESVNALLWHSCTLGFPHSREIDISLQFWPKFAASHSLLSLDFPFCVQSHLSRHDFVKLLLSPLFGCDVSPL